MKFLIYLLLASSIHAGNLRDSIVIFNTKLPKFTTNEYELINKYYARIVSTKPSRFINSYLSNIIEKDSSITFVFKSLENLRTHTFNSPCKENQGYVIVLADGTFRMEINLRRNKIILHSQVISANGQEFNL